LALLLPRSDDMTKTEEARLAEVARTAKNLRECIDSADSMIRSWARHKKEAGDISVFLSDRRVSRWHCSINLPADVVQAELIPVLSRIRDEAAKQLRELDPEIKSR
jgi:hypothetical protein